MKIKFLFLFIVVGLMFTGCASTQPQLGWSSGNTVASQSNGVAQRLLQKFGPQTAQTPVTSAEPVPVPAIENPVVKPEIPRAEKPRVPVKKARSKYQTGNTTSLERRVKRLAKEVGKQKNRLANLEDRFDASSVGNVKAKMIYFRPGSDKLLPAGEKYFDTLAEKALQHKVRNIIITGHASKAKKKGLNNLTLSEKRALSAQAYLRAKGIEALAIGKGETSRYTVNTNITVTYEEKN